MKIKIIKEVNSIINDKTYLVGEELTVTTSESFKDHYLHFYNLNNEETLDYIQKRSAIIIKEPLVINLLAGSGAGKSTNAARLFSMLKDNSIEVELVTEFAKDSVWEGRPKVFKCQPYIFGKQLFKLVRLEEHVDVIVTDSPLLLSAIYDNKKDSDFKKVVLNEFNHFKNLNFFLNRVKPFNPNGRNENNIEEAKANDRKLLNFLKEENISYTVVDGSKDGCEIMLKTILNQLKLLNEGI